MNPYTVFCTSEDGLSTTYIDCVEAEGVEHAKLAGQVQCAESWDCARSSVRVIGVVGGNAPILFWED